MTVPEFQTVVCLDVAVDSESALFRALGRILIPRDARLAAALQARMHRRHGRRSVVLGDGVALPRATLSQISRPRAAFVRCRRPLQMAAADGLPVTDVLALVVPHPALTAEVDLLMRAESALRRPELRALLRSTDDAAAVQWLVDRAMRG